MWRRMCYTISFSKLFPKLNPEIFENKTKVDLDLICLAYQNVFDDCEKRMILIYLCECKCIVNQISFYLQSTKIAHDAKRIIMNGLKLQKRAGDRCIVYSMV